MLSATPDSPRMFENDLFDFFSRTPALVVPVIYAPLVGWLVFRGFTAGTGPVLLIAELAIGVTLWTLTEYWLHRTLFHWIPDTWWGPKMHFFIHGVHHDWPADKYRLVMPPAVSLSLAVLFFGIFQAVGALTAGVLDPMWTWGTFAGFVIGYVGYDMIHYYVHHFRPRSKWMKRLRAHHMNHHHNHVDAKFGVSSMVWDRVFGTL